MEIIDNTFSNIVFGGASLSGNGAGYGFGTLDGCEPKDLINRAFELGITTFDFAPIYGFNNAEIEMGKHIQDKREKIQLISKAGVTWHENKRVDMNNDPKVIRKMFDQSLKNFQSDYIDLYFIHWPSKDVDIRHSVEVLYNLQAKGRIRYIGLSNTNSDEVQKAREVAPIDFIQSECNLFNQSSYFSKGISSMGWGTLDKGILSNSVKVKRKFEESDARSHAFWWKKSRWKDKVKFVENTCEKYELSRNELLKLALHFSKKNVQHSIIGVKSIEQLTEVYKLYNDQNLPDNFEEIVHEFSLF